MSEKQLTIYLLYGLGGRTWSAGIADKLGPKLRVIPEIMCPPTYQWFDWQSIARAISQLPASMKVGIAGHSLGANVIPNIAAAVARPIDLVIGYDPSIWYSCPALPRNVRSAICFHGVNWLNPIGHALYSVESANTKLATYNTWRLHTDIDDDDGLHGIAVNAFKALL